MLPLPEGPGALAPGDRWADTLTLTWSDDRGDHRYAVARALEVWDVRDSLGIRVVRVRSEAEVALRAAFVVDSLSGVTTTLDVRGPAEETFLFDRTRGRLLQRTWSMHLRGTGTVRVPGESVDTLPAGLVSEFRMTAATPERARMLARPLVGRDTTYAVSFGDASVVTHTASVAPTRVVGAWSAPSGVVSTVRLALERGVPTRLTWLRTAPLSPDRALTLVASEAGPLGAGARPDPSRPWAFWADGHEELLVPLTLSLPADSVPRPVALWAVERDRWLEGEALVLEVEGHTLCVVTLDELEPILSVLVAPDGELLYAERGTEAERAPAPGTEKRDFVEGLIRRFTERQDEPSHDPGRRS